MFNLLPLAVLLITCLAASAQTTLSGKIRDNRGRPIGGASISIKDTYMEIGRASCRERV